jgi:long-chain acyl-CoA synthetase
MNIALWLERAGKSHPGRPAAALGERVVLDYGALAARAARLAGALRTRCRLAPGDRVAIVAKNCVAYLEALYATWHAGLAAVPVNAKLHGAEVGDPAPAPASPPLRSTRRSRRSRRRRSKR